MQKVLPFLFLLAMFTGFVTAQVPVTPGTPELVNQALDEAPGEWAEAAIDLVVSHGIYIGYPDGGFGWRSEITRAEMALVIARLISAFDLDSFSAAEQSLLRQAVDDLSLQLAGLGEVVAEHDQALDLAAEALGRNTDELERLWSALTALEAAPPLFDASSLWNQINELNERMMDLEKLNSALLDQLERMTGEPTDIGPIQTRLQTFDAELEANRAALTGAQARLAELSEAVARVLAVGADLDRLEAALSEQEERHSSLMSRVDEAETALNEFEARQRALEEQLGALESMVADHEDRIARLEGALLPERAPFYLSAALYGSAPDGGLIGQVTIGYDAIIDNLGARASVDFGFGEVPLSLSGAVTYRATMDNVDGYAGIGMGISFEESGDAVFGELLLGVSYRLIRNLGVYVEGRYRPYFDGSGDGLAALGGGVQLRF